MGCIFFLVTLKRQAFIKQNLYSPFTHNCIIILDLLPHIKVKLIIGYLSKLS